MNTYFKSILAATALAVSGFQGLESQAQEFAYTDGLDRDAANAFYEALVFCHQEIETPIPVTQNQVVTYLTENFAGFPMDVQQNLTNARQILTQYRLSWHNLSLDDKLEFGDAIFSLAYGEERSAEILAPFYTSSSGGRSADDIIGSYSLDTTHSSESYGTLEDSYGRDD